MLPLAPPAAQRASAASRMQRFAYLWPFASLRVHSRLVIVLEPSGSVVSGLCCSPIVRRESPRKPPPKARKALASPSATTPTKGYERFGKEKTFFLLPCELPQDPNVVKDAWIDQFIQHLTTERGASQYTVRNYTQTLREFFCWHRDDRKQPPAWTQLQRDDFRAYLRFLGRNNMGRAAIQLRFSALRSFYKFLIRRGCGGAVADQKYLAAENAQTPPAFSYAAANA